MHIVKRFRLGLHPHRIANVERVISFLICFAMFTGHAGAVIRFQDRSLLVQDTAPGATTTYTLSFGFMTQTSVGSVDMLFCINPIPYMTCVPPTGIDVSHAVLANQTGETGFVISSKNANHIVLSRSSPAVVGNEQSSYVFTGIVNPTYTQHSFSIRLADYASPTPGGTPIDVGSVITQANNDIVLEAQVPPMLIFCVAQKVTENCASVDGGNNSDLGDLNPSQTVAAESEMGVGTNASSGFVITANGPPMEAGTHVIAPLKKPTASLPGTDQFGMNLVANSQPQIGSDPGGDSSNAIAAPDYSQPNKYTYNDGDVVAESPNVSLVRLYTVSYIVNVSPKLRAGVYTTTITYICTGRF